MIGKRNISKTITKIFSNTLLFMRNDDNNLIDQIGECLENMFKYWFAYNANHWFWNGVGEWFEASSLTTSKNDSFHGFYQR